jgi:pilus assembly protein Flp/PilA
MPGAFSAWKRLSADRTGVVSFEYILVAACVAAAVAAAFSTATTDALRDALTSAIGAVIALGGG